LRTREKYDRVSLDLTSAMLKVLDREKYVLGTDLGNEGQMVCLAF